MIKFKTSSVTVKIERIELTGPSLEVIDRARAMAPMSEGWRFVSQSLGENGLTEVREREVLRATSDNDTTEV